VEIKLSIAIPTYNGASTIRETLNSIVSQLEDSVETVVSDNASTDETAEIVQEYQSKYPVIRYFCNGENLGFDRNCDLAVRRSKGEYVWLFSDDDKLANGAIEKVMDVIRKYADIAAIFVNYKGSVLLNCAYDRFCLSGDDFFSKTAFKNGLISSNIIKKSVWGSIDVTKYFSTGWIHMGFLVEALSVHPAFIISHPFLLQVGAKEIRWGKRGSFFYTGLRLVKIFKIMSAVGYNESTIKRAIFVIKGGYLRNIPLAKAEGLRVDLALIKELYSLYKEFPSFWLLDLPLILLPRWVYQLVWKVYQIPLIKRIYRRSKSWIRYKWPRS